MKRIIWFMFFIMSVTPALAVAGEPDAYEIIGRAWDYMRGKTSVSVVHMTVHRSDWERKSTIKAWTKGREDSIFKIIAPKKDKGNGTLKLDRDMWTYNPKINRVVKIPPSMMSQSWMGSDFSNNDLSKADTILVDYTHEIIGRETGNGFIIYEIKSLPKPDAPVIWGMQTLKIREDGVLVEQAFYDEDLEAVKIMTTADVRDMGGRPFPLKWTMRAMDAESEQDYTLLEYESLSFDIRLRDNLFTLNALRTPLR
ncbi:MAG: outer membrane lipoprotein-sorting protein [Desulfobacterales bacterium]|nr:outer membrane lipoprotein-sorting protein [Desulfobacterales bacterium]